MLLLVDNYDSFTFNLLHYFEELGEELRIVQNDDLSAFLNDPSFDQALKGVEAICISPGPGTPARSGQLMPFLAHVIGKLPLLGVCLGHQALGEHFGATLGPAGDILHGKTSEVHHDSSGLFAGIPSPFKACRYHSLALKRGWDDQRLQENAQTEDGEIMAIAAPEAMAWGIQFHPEAILSQFGHQILQNFLNLARRIKV